MEYPLEQIRQEQTGSQDLMTVRVRIGVYMGRENQVTGLNGKRVEWQVQRRLYTDEVVA